MQVCWVCISRQAVGVRRRHRLEVAARRRARAAWSARSTARGSAGSPATRRTACGPGRGSGQPRSSQIRPSRSTSQPDSRCTSASGRSGRSSWQTRAERVDVAVDPVAAQRHPAHRLRLLGELGCRPAWRHDRRRAWPARRSARGRAGSSRAGTAAGGSGRPRRPRCRARTRRGSGRRRTPRRTRRTISPGGRLRRRSHHQITRERRRGGRRSRRRTTGAAGTPAGEPVRAAAASSRVMPQPPPVGVPGCSVSRQPIRPTAMPSATAGANRSPVRSAVAGQPLGDVHAEPGADQAAEDRAVAVEPLLGQARVLPQVDVLEPGAQPHEDGAADQGAHHDVQDPFVGLAAAARLVHEDEPGGQHAEQHEEAVGLHGQVDAQQVAEGGVHASGHQAGHDQRAAQTRRSPGCRWPCPSRSRRGLAGTPEAEQQDRRPGSGSDEQQRRSASRAILLDRLVLA